MSAWIKGFRRICNGNRCLPESRTSLHWLCALTRVVVDQKPTILTVSAHVSRAAHSSYCSSSITIRNPKREQRVYTIDTPRTEISGHWNEIDLIDFVLGDKCLQLLHEFDVYILPNPSVLIHIHLFIWWAKSGKDLYEEVGGGYINIAHELHGESGAVS